MDDRVQELLERQERWQKGRKDLSWPEKLRLAAALRDSLLALAAERRRLQGTDRKGRQEASPAALRSVHDLRSDRSR